ncbi:hypothetical protein DRN67_03530 [Candidatus Micrarchaeota archaeon]|nr:MAG: hypothetical protein DRN67_03530 [Candidatus Micrarchaeota archaeon]
MRALALFVLLLAIPLAHASIEKWNYYVGSNNYIYSSPVLYNNQAVFGSHKGMVYSVDVESGRGREVLRTSGHFDTHPLLVEDMIYIGSSDGKLYALDAESMILNWSADVGGMWQSSPAYADGVLYVGGLDGKVRALDALSGAELWSFQTGAEIDSTPAVREDEVYVASTDGTIYILGSKDGELEWKAPLGRLWTSAPLVDGNLLYIGSLDGSVYALNLESRTIEWKYSTEGGILSTPTIFQGSLIVGSNDHKVYSLSASNGDELWVFETKGSVQGQAAVANSEQGFTVYIGSNDDRIYALDGEDGSLKWSYDTGGWVASRPLIAGSLLIVPSYSERLHALSTQSCEFVEPPDFTSISGAHINLIGNAWSDFGISGVDVRLKQGAWQSASAGRTDWRATLSTAGLSYGEIVIECRTRSVEGIEQEPYNALTLYYSSMPVEHTFEVEYTREEVPFGSDVVLKITDEKGEPLAGITASWLGGSAISNQKGEVVVKAYGEGQTEITLSADGYETRVIKLKVGTNWALYAGIGFVLILAAYFLLMRRH